MKIKANLVFDSYCWESVEDWVPTTGGVFITYSCDKTNNGYAVSNVLLARATDNLQAAIRQISTNKIVMAEKNKGRRIYSTYAGVNDNRVAIASASAIQYSVKTLEQGEMRFKFFRYGDVSLTISGKWAFRVPKTVNLEVNECLKNLTADELSAFSTTAVTSKAGMEVRNAVDTAEDDAPNGTSWIEFWRRVVGEEEPKHCPNIDCNSKTSPLDGSHVVIKGDPKRMVYVMPLCASCNRSRSMEWMKIKPGVKMIPIDVY